MAVVGGVAALALGVPAAARGAQTEPDAPTYHQVRPCASTRGWVAPVADGVSWAQRRLMYTQLWTLSRGAGVKIAVIDTGVNPGQAFGGRLIAGGDLVSPAQSTHGLVDCDGHGTLVAGLIAARADPGTGFSGVAPDAQLISIRQHSSAYAPTDPNDRHDSAGTADSLAEAINVAVNLGAHVINISAAHCGPAAAAVSPRLDAAVAAAVRRDVVVVAAAGNVGSSPGCTAQNEPDQPVVTRALPAGVDDALTVGSMDPDGAASRFSLAGPWVDLAAPGSQLISTNPHPDRSGQVDRILTQNGVSEIQGTSFAAPYVTGVVALVRARHPRLTAQQVIQRLIATANPPVGGFTTAAGHGEVNPRRALTAVLPSERQAGSAVTLHAPQELRIAAPDPADHHPGRGPAVLLSALAAAAVFMLVTRVALRRMRLLHPAAPGGHR